MTVAHFDRDVLAEHVTEQREDAVWKLCISEAQCEI